MTRRLMIRNWLFIIAVFLNIFARIVKLKNLRAYNSEHYIGNQLISNAPKDLADAVKFEVALLIFLSIIAVSLIIFAVIKLTQYLQLSEQEKDHHKELQKMYPHIHPNKREAYNEQCIEEEAQRREENEQRRKEQETKERLQYQDTYEKLKNDNVPETAKSVISTDKSSKYALLFEKGEYYAWVEDEKLCFFPFFFKLYYGKNRWEKYKPMLLPLQHIKHFCFQGDDFKETGISSSKHSLTEEGVSSQKKECIVHYQNNEGKIFKKTFAKNLTLRLKN